MVAFDGQDVVRAAFAHEVVRVGALGVQRVRGDDRVGEVDAAGKGCEQRDLVRLDLHVDLPQDHPVGMVEGGE